MSTSFTRDSDRFRYAFAAIASVLVMFALGTASLRGVAKWAEREASSYPWRNEDWLRYLIPTMLGSHGRTTILIAGPSEAREDLLYEAIGEAFPVARVLQGGTSVGTFDDFLIGLEHWRRMYGDAVVPRTIVVGMSPRFLANLPRGNRVFANSITRYSPKYNVRVAPYGSSLVEKSFWEGIAARGRFLTKQPARYRAALCTVLLRTILRTRPEAFTPLTPPVVDAQASPIGRRPPTMAGLERCRSPYRYRLAPAVSQGTIAGWIRDPESFWYAAHQWDPDSELEQIEAQFDRLRDMAAELDITLIAVNLPEHPLNRVAYRPEAYSRYLELVREAFGADRFLDLRDLLPASHFHDAGHATAGGAVLVTDSTIHFLRNLGFPSAIGAPAATGVSSQPRSHSQRPGRP